MNTKPSFNNIFLCTVYALFSYIQTMSVRLNEVMMDNVEVPTISFDQVYRCVT